MDVVEQLIRQESNFSRVLWGLLQLELWHREFLDAGSDPVIGSDSCRLVSRAPTSINGH